jgi:hypothetical protein
MSFKTVGYSIWSRQNEEILTGRRLHVCVILDVCTVEWHSYSSHIIALLGHEAQAQD